MKKILVLCGSDVLGLPALLHLRSQNAISCVALPTMIEKLMVPVLKNAGITEDQISVLTKQGFERELESLIRLSKPDAIFVFTFPWLIPSSILKLLPGKCINFHPGLLPKYKGADPVFWQLRNGESLGGVGIHLMTEEIDSGPVLCNAELPIFQGETYGLYAQRVGVFIAGQLNNILELIDTAEKSLITQTASPAQYFKKPGESDLVIQWNLQTAEEITNLVNAANPRYGGAVTIFRQKLMRVLEVLPVDVNNPAEVAPGTVVYADSIHGIIISCINLKYLKLSVVQIQEGFLSGAKLFSMGVAVGERLG